MQSILLIITGLVLFLYALNTLSQSLKTLAGDKLKNVLNRFTSNTLKGIFSGFVVTVLLDSSSVVIIMTIALVNAGALNFRQTMGVVMGANIGTTISSQIFALGLGLYASVPMLAGFALMFFAKQNWKVELGKVLFGFGLIFFGLFTIEEAVAPLKNSGYFVAWLERLEAPWRGVLTGAAVTVLLQSSSATVGMVISLAKQGLMNIAAGIAVMLGAELGTCADTLVASIGRSRTAVRTGLFHLLFNIISVCLGLLLLAPFTQLVLRISNGAGVPQIIANAHILFNSLGVLLLLPLVPLFDRFITALVPGTQPTQQPHTAEMG